MINNQVQQFTEKNKEGYEMIDVEIENMNGNQLSPILAAIKHGDTQKLQRELLKNPNFLEVDKAGGNILHYAAYYENPKLAIEMSELIIGKIQDDPNCNSVLKTLLNAEHILKMTPLGSAAKRFNWKLMKILLDAGAIPNITKFNKTILHLLTSSPITSEDETVQCVRTLCNLKYFNNDPKKFQEYLDVEEEVTQNTALQLAAIHGNAQIIQELIQQGANPLKVDYLNCNVLHYACELAIEKEAFACTSVLLKDDMIDGWDSIKRSLLEASDETGKCPVHIAARRGFPTLLPLMKDYFYLHEGNTGYTPLHSAARFGNEQQAGICVQEILRNTPDSRISELCNAQDGDGSTPLYLAAKEKNVSAAKLLLLAGSAFDIKNKRGRTPLEKVYEKIPQAVTVLLQESIKNSGYVAYFRSINTFADIDYGPILGYSTSRANVYKETQELAKVCNAKFDDRKAILNHIFIRIYIHEKWQKVKWFFHVFRFLHILWFLLNCIFVVWTYRYVCPIPGAKNFTWVELRPLHSTEATTALEDCLQTIPNTLVIAGYLNLGALLIYLFCQFHGTKQKFHYIFRPAKTKKNQNRIIKFFRLILYYAFLLLKILPTGQLIIATGIFITILPTIWFMPFSEFVHFFIAGMVGLGVWIAICLEAMKFPRFSFYKNLLWKSGKTLLIAIVVTAPILCGFASLFSILIPEEPSFSSPLQSLVKVITFMIGELDYGDLLYGETESVFLGWIMLFMALFVVIVVVLLVNFLIGLAAEEISDVWDRAVIWDLCTKLEQIHALESILDEQIPMFGRGFLRRHLMLMPPDKDRTVIKQRRVAFVRLMNLPKQYRKEFHELRFGTIRKVQ